MTYMDVHFTPFSKFVRFAPLIFLTLPVFAAFVSWERTTQPVASENMVSLALHPTKADTLLAASASQVLEGTLAGDWQTLWHTAGLKQRIRRVLSFAELPGKIFVLTTDGAFVGDVSSRRWSRFFHGRRDSANDVLSMTLSNEDPDHWLLGTQGGLFESDDGGRTWFPFPMFRNVPVPVVAFHEERLFVATPSKFYFSDDLRFFQLSLSLSSRPDSPLAGNDAIEPSQPEDLSNPFDFTDITWEEKRNRLWLASRVGVFESRNHGLSWILLPRSGLRNMDIRHLSFFAPLDRLLAAAREGIYVYDFNRGYWKELFRGLSRTEARALLVVEFPETGSILLAATPDGLLRYPLLPDDIAPVPEVQATTQQLLLFRRLLRLEPTARDIQREVIRYANVSGSKIQRWHAASRLRSLLPDVSFSRDFARSNNIDIDRGSTKDPDYYIFGPDDESEGWDLDVSWDLGDLFWSSSQTSIDSREKLMVELRQDLLSEATRLYHERRRLQIEIVLHPAITVSDHLERLIRMDELTSLLDAMTNGYLTRRLKAIYGQAPELEALWAYQVRDAGS